MNDIKINLYKKLVSERKKCTICAGLTNPSFSKYDCEEIGQWTIWQRNLDADILVVGQDWGDEKYFIDNYGKDIDNNPTNKNLITLFNSIGIDIGTPNKPNNKLFFTNAILCLKKGGMGAKTNDEWYYNCQDCFLKPLIKIIEPKIIITLGSKAFNSVLSLYGKTNYTFSKAVDNSPIELDNNIKFFPVYHCGSRGVNINRSWHNHFKDWANIKDYIS